MVAGPSHNSHENAQAMLRLADMPNETGQQRYSDTQSIQPIADETSFRNRVHTRALSSPGVPRGRAKARLAHLPYQKSPSSNNPRDVLHNARHRFEGLARTPETARSPRRSRVGCIVRVDYHTSRNDRASDMEAL